MHLNDGMIRSYLDNEAGSDKLAETRRHLTGCPICAARLEQIIEDRSKVESSLAVLDPVRTQTPGFLAAKTTFSSVYRVKKENNRMWDQLFTRRLRPVWAFALVAVITAVMLSIPAVRAAANTFLGFFRVEQIAVVEINPANLPDQLGSSVTFEELLSQDIHFEKFGEALQVDSRDTASAESGMAVRLPAEANGEPQLWVESGSQVSFDIDLARLRLLLTEIGRSDVDLPDDLDGAEATLRVQPSVLALYGSCDLPKTSEAVAEAPDRKSQNCTYFAQIPSPSISAPEGLNLAEIGRAFLRVMGMTEAEAARFSDTIDWTTTLVVPIPQSTVNYLDVRVDGVAGVMFQQDPEWHQPGYMLLWVKEGVIYSLSGMGDGSEGIRLANSLR